MNWKMMMCALAVSLLGTSLSAQMGGMEEEEDGGEWGYILETYDHDKDGKITLAEVKKTAAADSEGAEPRDVIETYGYYLMDFLAMDGNDDEVLTKDDYAAYSKRVDEEGKNAKFSAKDWKKLESEYLDPMLALDLKEYDKDGDGALTKEEAKAMDGFDAEEFDGLDANKDGKVTTDEFKTAYKGFMKEMYDIEDGVEAVEEPEVSPEVMKKAKAAFGEWDTDGDGFATKAEMNAASELKTGANWWGQYIAFLAMDTDDDLKVSFDEFLKAGLASRAGEKGKLYPVDEKEACKEVWLGLDGDEDGKVTEAEWKKAFPMSDEFAGADTDKSGDISKKEFWTLLKPSLEDSFEFIDKDKPSKTTSGSGDTEDKPADDDSDASGNADDAYNLYRKKGRSWTLKSSTGGMEIYIKTEVIEVGKDFAKVQTSMLDKEGKPFMGMQPTESKIDFVKSNGETEEPEGLTKVEKTITVEAGEIECIGYKMGDQEVQAWMHKKYPGLLVKAETLELVEFNE